MDENAIQKAIARITHEIVERNENIGELAIVGIRNKGEYLAKRIAAMVEKIENRKLPIGILDITLYRDDLTSQTQQPVVNQTIIDFDVSTKQIILVDDVLYTGRTIRSALDELIDFGRPKSIQLAVLIDRGHRELPIRADYVGKNIPTSKNEMVEVRLYEVDGKDEIVILERD
jgi:pyrimidine operon attenuation protein/uracil phosphoribosyltransferase